MASRYLSVHSGYFHIAAVEKIKLPYILIFLFLWEFYCAHESFYFALHKKSEELQDLYLPDITDIIKLTGMR